MFTDASMVQVAVPSAFGLGAWALILWRTGRLEKRMDDNDKKWEKKDEENTRKWEAKESEAKEDRRRLHEEINKNHGEFVELRGELRGSGHINGKKKE